MVQQIINTGTAPNDGTGDTLKTSFTKANANFTELYAKPPGNAYTTSPTAPSSPNAGDFWYDTTTGILASYVNDGNSSQWVEVAPSIGNIGSVSSVVATRVITITSSYVPTAGTQFIVVECVGGGGGGGYANANAAGQYIFGAGGGGGGYSRSTFTAAQIGASQAIMIGAGGLGSTVAQVNGAAGADTSFGGLCIARGGGGGGYSSAADANQMQGGAGGVPGVGDVTASGSPGGPGFYNSGGGIVPGTSGNGGSSIFGGGAVGATTLTTGTTGTANGVNATNYGGGGSGGFVGPGGGSTATGGNGAPGVVVITEYNIGAGQQGPQGLAGGVTTPLTPQGRLTLLSGSPVMTTTQSNKTTIYYTPYVGNQIPIWNGSSWATSSFNELSAVTTDTTKSPAAIGASKMNDWFVWNDAGTIRLGHGPDWTSDTTRSAGTALVRQNGIWLNNAAITNGPAASRGTYVGTTRSGGANSLQWILGTAAVGGGQAFLAVWNCYNRVNVSTTVSDTTASWVYNSATPRYADANPNNAVYFLYGLAEDSVNATYIVRASPGADYFVSVGLDVVNHTTGTTAYGNGNAQTGVATFAGNNIIGLHALNAIESVPSPVSGTTFFGFYAAGFNLQHQGLTFTGRM